MDDRGDVTWEIDPEHLEKEGCAGLLLYPTQLLVLKLKRRAGKTFNFSVFATAMAAILPRQYETYLAVSEEQTQKLATENFLPSYTASPELAEVTRITGGKIEFLETGSVLEFTNSSHGSGTGFGRALLGFDECRDLPNDTFTQLIPGIFDQRGVECPNGHWRVPYGAPFQRTCPVANCGARSQPWYGRVVAMSSAPRLKGGEHDWFAELVEQLQLQPDPGMHLYCADSAVNPAVAKQTTGTIERVFGRVESLKHAVDIEIHNVSRASGEDYLTASEVSRATGKSLANSMGSVLPCVGHLDCSLNNELTSLVILADVSDGDETPWNWVEMLRLDVWDPKGKEIGGHPVPDGQMDETLVRPHLEWIIQRFPGLRTLTVDTRGWSWPSRITREFRPHGVVGLQRNETQRDTAYADLEERVRAKAQQRDGGWPVGRKAIRLIDSALLQREFRAARKFKNTKGRHVVKEAKRHVLHLDVVDSLAMACLAAFNESLRSRTTLTQIEAKSSALGHIYRPIVKTPAMRGF